jgi:hypothetical protein
MNYTEFANLQSQDVKLGCYREALAHHLRAGPPSPPTPAPARRPALPSPPAVQTVARDLDAEVLRLRAARLRRDPRRLEWVVPPRRC